MDWRSMTVTRRIILPNIDVLAAGKGYWWIPRLGLRRLCRYEGMLMIDMIMMTMLTIQILVYR